MMFFWQFFPYFMNFVSFGKNDYFMVEVRLCLPPSFFISFIHSYRMRAQHLPFPEQGKSHLFPPRPHPRSRHCLNRP
jgi:hypothetical protein